MNCDFLPTDACGEYRCQRCGGVVAAPHGVGRIHRRCQELPIEPPAAPRRAWNVLRAAAVFVADGMRTVTADVYRARLAACDGCPLRQDNTCRVCGCRLSLKARGRLFQCPLGKWRE
jgi:hypothetical protein